MYIYIYTVENRVINIYGYTIPPSHKTQHLPSCFSDWKKFDTKKDSFELEESELATLHLLQAISENFSTVRVVSTKYEVV